LCLCGEIFFSADCVGVILKTKEVKAMKERILLILSLILALTSLVFAQTNARKTVTNADLEKFRQKRLQAEADYRANYKRLGMPSPEELDQREAERQRWLAEFAEQAEIERAENENYFLSRAGELRTQIASIEAQINYLRSQTNNSSNRGEFVGGTITSPYFFGGAVRGVSGGRFRRGAAGVAPNVQTVRNYARSFPSAGDIRNQIYGTYPQLNRRSPRRYRGGNYGGGYVVSGGYYGIDDLTYLEQQRAGLLAEWQILEEEARRAGVRID
jgi:hypothetical protein